MAASSPIAEFWHASTPEQRAGLRSRMTTSPTPTPGCVYGLTDTSDKRDTHQYIKIGRTAREPHVRAAEWGMRVLFVVYTNYSNELETRAHKLFAFARIERLGPRSNTEHEWFRVGKYANVLGAIQALNDAMDAPGVPTPSRTLARDLRININTATAATLQQLPGIGAAISLYIVEHRAKHGPFKDICQLRDVRMIDEKRFATIAPMVIVGAPHIHSTITSELKPSSRLT